MATHLLSFRADGEPKGQPRPRAFARVIAGKAVARVYDAGSAEGWKSLVAIAAREHIPPEPIRRPLWVKLDFDMPRPKSHFRTGRNAGCLKEGATCWHEGKPDVDNLAKAVLDALTTLGLWADDCLIAELVVTKRYGPRPGVLVTVGFIEARTRRTPDAGEGK